MGYNSAYGINAIYDGSSGLNSSAPPLQSITVSPYTYPNTGGQPWYQPTYVPSTPVVPVITLPDPRIEELEKRLAAAEEKIAKLLPKILELMDPPESDGKRVVEL